MRKSENWGVHSINAHSAKADPMRWKARPLIAIGAFGSNRRDFLKDVNPWDLLALLLEPSTSRGCLIVRGHWCGAGDQKEHASKVLELLAAAGIVASTRGRQGGYALLRKLDEISVIEVLDALNPARDKNRLDAQSCTGVNVRLCRAHRGLLRLEDRVREALAGETLGGLAGGVCTVEAVRKGSRLAYRSPGVRKLVATS